jgi:hypothetical protein
MARDLVRQRRLLDCDRRAAVAVAVMNGGFSQYARVLAAQMISDSYLTKWNERQADYTIKEENND